MKKIKAPEKIKDPKKVAAGKARAATGIKDINGKYVNKLLVAEITKIALARKGVDATKIKADQPDKLIALMNSAKVTAKEVKELYDSKPQIFARMIEEGTVKGTSKNSNQIESSITETDRKIFINGKECTKAQAKKKLMDFKQYLSSNLNVVDFTINPELDFVGGINYRIPDVKKLLTKVLQHFDLEHTSEITDIDAGELTEAIEDILNDMDLGDYVVIYSSSKKAIKEKAKKQKEKDNDIVHKRKSMSNKIALCGATGSITYTHKDSLVNCKRCLNMMR